MCWKKSCSVGRTVCIYYLKNHNVLLRSLCLWPKIHYMLLPSFRSFFFPFIILYYPSFFSLLIFPYSAVHLFWLASVFLWRYSLKFTVIWVNILCLLFSISPFFPVSFPPACSWQISLKLFKLLQQVRVPLVTYLQFFQFITNPDARHQRSVILSVGYDE